MAKRNENKDIRDFGIALAVLLGGFAAFGWYRDGECWPILAGVAVVSLVLALFGRPVLRPIFKGWMWLAYKINWFTTRLILTMAWVAMFLPIGLVLHLFRKDFFDRKWEPNKSSYWRVRPEKPFDRRRAERLG